MEITIRLAITDKTAFFVETDRTPFAEPRTDVLCAVGNDDEWRASPQGRFQVYKDPPCQTDHILCDRSESLHTDHRAFLQGVQDSRSNQDHHCTAPTALLSPALLSTDGDFQYQQTTLSFAEAQILIVGPQSPAKSFVGLLERLVKFFPSISIR